MMAARSLDSLRELLQARQCGTVMRRMRSPLIPFLIAAAVTVLIGVGVRMEPYFAGDVRVTRPSRADTRRRRRGRRRSAGWRPRRASIT